MEKPGYLSYLSLGRNPTYWSVCIISSRLAVSQNTAIMKRRKRAKQREIGLSEGKWQERRGAFPPHPFCTRIYGWNHVEIHNSYRHFGAFSCVVYRALHDRHAMKQNKNKHNTISHHQSLFHLISSYSQVIKSHHGEIRQRWQWQGRSPRGKNPWLDEEY